MWLPLFPHGCFSVCGQSYTGKVIDKDSGAPIDGVYVCLLSVDSLAQQYTSSDAKGLFKIEYVNPAEIKYLSFSCLGYKGNILSLEIFHNGMQVALQPEAFRLDEVRVSAQRIVEKCDTLVYSVAGFAMPQDRSIVEVIAKMPGLEVKPDGRIEFEGKGINKFYVEGMDLMGDHYALAGNNISRKRVKEVQVLRNHQPVRLLRGKSFSEQAAINLVLEDASKYSLVGTVEGAVGANADDILYNNRLLAMLFGRDRQNLSIYKNDNTGYDLYHEINPVTLQDAVQGTVPEEYLVSTVSLASPGFDCSRYTFNRSHLVATNHLERLSRSSTLKTQISYFNDNTERSNKVETVYLFSDSVGASMHEQNLLYDRCNRMDIGLNYEKNDEHIYLKNNLTGMFDWLSARSRTMWNDNEQKLESKFRRSFLMNELEITLPLSVGRYFTLSSINTFNNLPQSLLLCTGENQLLDYTSFHSHTYTSFRHKLWGMYIKYSLGMKISRQSLSAKIEKEQTIPDQHLTKWEPYIGPTFTYQTDFFQLQADLLLKMRMWRFSRAEGNLRTTSFHPDLNVFMKYALNGASFLTARYRIDNELPDLRNAYQGDLFITYHTQTDNARPMRNGIVHRFSLGYQYSQPIRGIFFSFVPAVSFTHNHSTYATALDTEYGILSRKRVEASYITSNYTLTSRFSKSFNWWKSLLIIRGMYLHREDAQMNEKVLKDYDLDTYSAAISFASRPLTFFSFELESAWQSSRLRSYSTNTQVNLFHHALKTVFPISSRWMFQLDNSLYRSMEANKNFWFMDFLSRYSYKGLELELKVNNVIGHVSYEQEFVSSIEQNNCLFMVRPREIVAKVSFSF